MNTFKSLSAIVILSALVFAGARNSISDSDNTRLDYIYYKYKQQDNGNAYSVHRFDASNGENLEVRTSGGSIKVKGADVVEAEIRMYVRKGGKYLFPKDTDLSNFDIEIKKTGNTILASVGRRDVKQTILSRNNESISFEVLIPKSFNIDVNTSGGSISLDELNGSLQAKTSGGSLSLNNLGGVIDARTSGGSISVNESGGSISVRTSGGSISAKNSAGKVEMSTSGGSITLDNLSGEVDASTSGGSIRSNMLKVEGPISLRTSGGTIRATLPEGLGYDLELKGNSVNIPLQNFTGETKRSSVTGSMNGGGYAVNMRTSGGSVNVEWN
jgi:hypothetical protein